MAAGLGFKAFTTGEVLTAGDVNGYLMQGINVFADAAARSAAITSPQEGQYSYLKDSNSLWYYSGSAWVAAGGSPLTTKGDVYGYSTTDARIPVGANDTVLTADSAQALGVKWATPSSGGMTLLSTTTITGTPTTVTVSSINQTYKSLYILLQGITVNINGSFWLRVNGVTTGVYTYVITSGETSSVTGQSGTTGVKITGPNAGRWYAGTRNLRSALLVEIPDYATTSYTKIINFSGMYDNSITGDYMAVQGSGAYNPATSAAITSFSIFNNDSSFDAGQILVYGVK